MPFSQNRDFADETDPARATCVKLNTCWEETEGLDQSALKDQLSEVKEAAKELPESSAFWGSVPAESTQWNSRRAT